MSEKSTSLRLVSISRLKPISSNTLMMFFLTLSVSCPLRFPNKASPLPRYSPKFDFGSTSLVLTGCKVLLVHIFLLDQNYPL